MISLELAQQLRDAGLAWRPAERDSFVLPGRGMDEQIFVVSPVPAIVQLYNGQPVVAFQASAEWALDYVMLTEALWLPEEGQLREALAGAVAPEAELRVERLADGYSCTVGLAGAPARFDGPDAATAMGRALLAALQQG
jgi:hypothetical protein